jgi:hypothetical protein
MLLRTFRYWLHEFTNHEARCIPYWYRTLTTEFHYSLPTRSKPPAGVAQTVLDPDCYKASWNFLLTSWRATNPDSMQISSIADVLWGLLS